MKILIRHASLDADRRLIIEFLHRHLTPLSDESRFEWLYVNNPHGRASVWIAMNAEEGQPIGMAAAFPRRTLVGGRHVLGWVLGDFCISGEHRSLGPALQLQRACLEAIDSGSIGFCYDFPSSGMMAVYRRLGISASGEMVRLAKPLRVDRKVAGYVKLPLVREGLSLGGNLLLRLLDGISVSSADLDFALHQGPCGAEFTTLAEGVSERYGLAIERSAAYLNWRFLSNPLVNHQIMTVRRRERLIGYVIFAQSGDDVSLIDIFGENDSRGIAGLLTKLVALMRKRRVTTLSASLFSSHPWSELFSGQGFRTRERIPVVSYWGPDFKEQMSQGNRLSWCLTSGDRDS